MSTMTRDPAYAARAPRVRPDDAPRGRGAARSAFALVPLGLILIAQSILTIKLARWAFASGDEGRYIYAGHQLIYELFHGGGSPYYETYFSGAPVIYPVLAAVADSIGGLLAVRLMSLVFMLTATCLLFDLSRRWFGYWPGVLGAGLFAGVGLTQDLGALATHDAMSLMLVTVAAYCASRTGDDERAASQWLVAVPLVLFLANAAKYASVLFDPVVIGIAACQVISGGLRRTITRVTALSLATGVTLGVAAVLAGSAYLQGVTSSTLNRNAASAVFAGTTVSARTVIIDSWDWIGSVIVLAVLALLVAVILGRSLARTVLLLVLLVAGVLVTVEGVHLHTIESMYKHDDFGIWFTSAGAASVVCWLRSPVTKAVIALLLILGSGYVYTHNVVSTYQADDSALSLREYGALKPYLELGNARYMLGGLSNEDVVYVDHLAVPWFRLFDDVYLKYPIPGRGGDSHGRAVGRVCLLLKPGCMYLEGAAGYRAAIRAHWFALISMIGEHYSGQDAVIADTVLHTPGYVRLTQVPGPPTWIYAADYPSVDR
jgi:hypothetical protein